MEERPFNDIKIAPAQTDLTILPQIKNEKATQLNTALQKHLACQLPCGGTASKALLSHPFCLESKGEKYFLDFQKG